MTVPDFAFLLGLGAALIEEWDAKGRSVGWWGVALIALGLLIGHFFDL